MRRRLCRRGGRHDWLIWPRERPLYLDASYVCVLACVRAWEGRGDLRHQCHVAAVGVGREVFWMVAACYSDGSVFVCVCVREGVSGARAGRGDGVTPAAGHDEGISWSMRFLGTWQREWRRPPCTRTGRRRRSCIRRRIRPVGACGVSNSQRQARRREAGRATSRTRPAHRGEMPPQEIREGRNSIGWWVRRVGGP
jgi:hypothetical protein